METRVRKATVIGINTLPSRRGNQLNGNRLAVVQDNTFIYLPSRRGNQLNGNRPLGGGYDRSASSPLSQGKPIEWKPVTATETGEFVVGVSPLAGETN